MCITRPLGFRAAATAAGLKASGKPDLALLVMDPGDRPEHQDAAAVFTRSVVPGAPIIAGKAWRSAYLGSTDAPPLRALLINSGQANAATGSQGLEDIKTKRDLLSEHLNISPEETMTSSTGVIGRRVRVERIAEALPALVSSLARGADADESAARAIMTTDLTSKPAHREFELDGHAVHIGAIAKGSGMIAPYFDSAQGAHPQGKSGTMLAFITTDAPFARGALQRALEHAAQRSFDRISVDSDLSTSDSAIALASAHVPIEPILPDTPRFEAFALALASICQDLAEQIVRDGEGATRTFRITVRGTQTDHDARLVAKAIVDSPLVKCAIHGKDPNWGRFLMAAGKAGVEFDPAAIRLDIADIPIYDNNAAVDPSLHKDQLASAMNAPTVEVKLRLGDGPGTYWMLGCDLSKEYVTINALYTT